MISDPNVFEAAIHEQIAILQAQDAQTSSACQRVQAALDELMVQRQWVITAARKRAITEEDMDFQLGALHLEELSLQREIADQSLLLGERVARLQEIAQAYLADVRAGAVLLNGKPQNEDEARLQFELRKKIVNEIVKRVDVAADGTLTLTPTLTPWPPSSPAE